MTDKEIAFKKELEELCEKYDAIYWQEWDYYGEHESTNIGLRGEKYCYWTIDDFFKRTIRGK